MKNEITPPTLATRLLNSFMRSDLAEEVRGDLEEKFYSDIKTKAIFKAKLFYWYQVLNYLRPFAIRKSRLNYLTNYDMFQSYFKIGWRNLLRNKGYSAINIGGLAMGMTVSIIIGLWILDELSFDSYFLNHKRLAQVMLNQTGQGIIYTGGTIAPPIEEPLRTKYGNDFKSLSLVSFSDDAILAVGDKRLSHPGIWVEKDFPEMFSLNLISGSRSFNDVAQPINCQSFI
jgi:putative ABC transport system permease protein